MQDPTSNERQTTKPNPGDQARQRLAGVALLIAVALGAGVAPGAWGLAAYQLAFCGNVERVWNDLAREVAGDRGGSGTSTARAVTARQWQGAIAKAVRDLLKGSARDVADLPMAGQAIPPARLAGSMAPLGFGPSASNSIWTYAIFAQPPPATL